MCCRMKYGSRHVRKTVVSQEETNLNSHNEEKLKLNHSFPPSICCCSSSCFSTEPESPQSFSFCSINNNSWVRFTHHADKQNTYNPVPLCDPIYIVFSLFAGSCDSQGWLTQPWASYCVFERIYTPPPLPSSFLTTLCWKLTHPQSERGVSFYPSTHHDKHSSPGSWPGKVATPSAILAHCPFSADEGLLSCSPLWPRVWFVFHSSPKPLFWLFPVFFSVSRRALLLDPTEPRSTTLHNLHQSD